MDVPEGSSKRPRICPPNCNQAGRLSLCTVSTKRMSEDLLGESGCCRGGPAGSEARSDGAMQKHSAAVAHRSRSRIMRDLSAALDASSRSVRRADGHHSYTSTV